MLERSTTKHDNDGHSVGVTGGERLRRLQEAGALGIGLRREKDNEEATMLLFHSRCLTAELVRDAATVKQLLRIQPDVTEVRIAYGADTPNENEVALLTRSGFQVMMELASLVSVPPEDVADNWTYG